MEIEKKLDTDIQSSKKSGKLEKKKVIMVASGILLVGILIAIYFLYQGNTYVSTIDARIDSNMVSVNAPASGMLEDWAAQEGEMVKKGEILGRIGSTTITSPIDGSVVKISIGNGQAISQGQIVSYIGDTENLYISANIEETKINRIKIGQNVQIKVDAFNGEKLKGEVTNIGKAANSVFSMIPSGSANGSYTKITQLIPIRIDISDKLDLKLLPGMNAEIKIDVTSK